MMLGVLAAGVVCGCENAQESESSFLQAESHSQVQPAVASHGSRTSAPHPAVEEAERELGHEAAAAMGEVVHEVPVQPEPGARAVVDAIAMSLHRADVEEGDGVWISVCKVRNFSRSGREEFIEFRRRLADVLNIAGREHSLNFTADAEREAEYVITGSAYMVMADGFDQWELYLRLCPADEGWTIWRLAGPVRILRHARAGQPQIIRWPPPEV